MKIKLINYLDHDVCAEYIRREEDPKDIVDEKPSE